MPTSPNSRTGGEGNKPPLGETSSAVPTNEGKKDPQTNSGTASSLDSSAEQPVRSRSSRRLQRQNLMQRYSKLREDAQLAGLIKTEPAEAVKDERVKHDDPKLIERAIRSGWAVPEEVKPELVAEMTAIVTDDSEESSDKTKVAAFRALLAADQAQHERDNPAAKKGGATVNVSVQTNIAAVDVLRAAMRRDGQDASTSETTTPRITSSTGDSRLGGEVETDTAPPSDK